MKLLDAILTSKRFIPLQPKGTLDMEWWEIRELQLRRQLLRAEAFEIGNVAEYFYAGTDQEQWSVFEDFPCLMSPFPHVWMEYSTPSICLSEVHGTLSNNRAMMGTRAGVLISTVPCSRPHGDASRTWGGLVQEPPHPPDAAHIQCCTLFIERFGQCIGPIFSVSYWLLGDGTPRSHDGDRTIIAIPKHRPEYEHLLDQAQYSVWHVPVYPAQLALTFLNCRNTVVMNQAIPPKLNKSHIHKHGRPMVTFRTLEIEPVKKIFAANGVGDNIKRALHVCRGHFKDYREHGLFGRHKGLYWWGMQIRGTLERGAVVKDYAIKAPSA